jgi:hypothetical protein
VRTMRHSQRGRNDFGRQWQVYVEAEARLRDTGRYRRIDRKEAPQASLVKRSDVPIYCPYSEHRSAQRADRCRNLLTNVRASRSIQHQW